MPVNKKLSLNFAAAFSQAEESMDGFNWQTPTGFDPAASDAATTYTNGALNTFYTNWTELNAMLPTYSDLDYTQLNVSLGGTYNFSDNLYMMAKAQYEKFDDDQPYVYGDQDGTAITGNIGVGYNF
ncbi:MAG: hypothetical protein C0623_11075 [Desulfuromonas sp.]|nr:MAG: hypothetical protein C0623_11075 [Desulfuromonas sp.]